MKETFVLTFNYLCLAFLLSPLHLTHLRLQNKHLHRDMKKKPRVTEVSVSLHPSLYTHSLSTTFFAVLFLYIIFLLPLCSPILFTLVEEKW